MTFAPAGILGVSTNEVRAQTPIERARETLSNASDLVLHITKLAERLTGPAPQQEGSGGDAPKPLGLLNELHIHALNTQADIDRAHAALMAIERMLP